MLYYLSASETLPDIIRGVAFGGSGLIRGVVFGGSGLIGGGLLYY